VKSAELGRIRKFRLTKWRERLNEFSDDSEIKSLREEIGILRILLEEQMNTCTSTNELIMHSGRIGDLILKIEKLVSSCHRLDTSLGGMLDKSAAHQFSLEVVKIIQNELSTAIESIVTDTSEENINKILGEVVIDAIVRRLSDALTHLNKPDVGDDSQRT